MFQSIKVIGFDADDTLWIKRTFLSGCGKGVLPDYETLS